MENATINLVNLERAKKQIFQWLLMIRTTPVARWTCWKYLKDDFTCMMLLALVVGMPGYTLLSDEPIEFLNKTMLIYVALVSLIIIRIVQLKTMEKLKINSIVSLLKNYRRTKTYK